MANTKLLFIDQGSNFSFSITANYSSGTTINITSGSGWTASGKLRRSYYSSSSVPFSCALGSTAGYVEFSLSATSTASMKVGRYVYDGEVLGPSGQTYRIVQGNAYIDPEVTK